MGYVELCNSRIVWYTQDFVPKWDRAQRYVEHRPVEHSRCKLATCIRLHRSSRGIQRFGQPINQRKYAAPRPDDLDQLGTKLTLRFGTLSMI